MNKSVTIQKTIDLLNEAFRADPISISALLEHRELCNLELANHPTIQISKTKNEYEIGILGIINGLFGVDDFSYGPICVVYDDDGEMIRFERFQHTISKIQS